MVADCNCPLKPARLVIREQLLNAMMNPAEKTECALYLTEVVDTFAIKDQEEGAEPQGDAPQSESEEEL
eukprot:gene48195-25253_t